MLRNTLPSYSGLVLFQAPSRRQKMARRRAFLAAAFAGLALAGGVIGALSKGPSDDGAPGAFSYFPSE